MKYVLFNPLSNNRKGQEGVEELVKLFDGAKYEEKSLLELDKKAFEASLTKEDEIYLLGGDGTLNNFINDFDCDKMVAKVFMAPSGTGNDFFNSLAKDSDKVLEINKYIKRLPKVYIKGMERKFINGIGYGIDGYCCEVADKQKAAGKQDINYTSIAIKGLLFHFKKKNAVVKVDGEVHEYKQVWLAASMNGSMYGGGMLIAPEQDRLEKDKKLTICVFKGRSKIRTLMVFPKIFEGKLANYPKRVSYLRGKEIEVTFNEPCALQIDGETVLDVTSYKVVA